MTGRCVPKFGEVRHKYEQTTIDTKAVVYLKRPLSLHIEKGYKIRKFLKEENEVFKCF